MTNLHSSVLQARNRGGALVNNVVLNICKVTETFPGGIRVICRNSSNTANVEKFLPSAEIMRGEMTDKAFMSEALNDVDTVIHVAGIQRSRNVVDTAVKCRVRRLILVHTTGIYSKYKSAGEEYRRIDEYVEAKCKKNNIVLTILRPTMIYGNITDENVVTFIRLVDKLPIMPAVNGARFALQPVNCNDLGKAYFDVLMNEENTANRNYDLSGGEVITLRDMLSVIGDSLHKKVRFLYTPFWFAYSGAWFLFILTIGKIDYRERVQRLCEPRAYSYEATAKDFGYNPMTFREGIVDEVKEYLEQR